MHNTVITKEFSFTKKNENDWILEHSDKYFIVSDAIKSLLDILKKNQFDYNNSYNDFIHEFEYVDRPTFDTIVNNNLESLELNQSEDELISSPKKEKSFILFETQLLSPTLAGRISKLIQPLYQPTFFWIAFTLLFALSIYNMTTFHHLHMGKTFMIGMFVLYIISAFIHEFGHIAACNRFTNKNGEIGVGIYFLFPVFYSNITPIWTANKEQRIITNLAGVYIQLYLIAILYGINYFLDIHELEDVIILSTMIILYQLIPFIRTDGYWILSDLTDSPNLLPNSNKQLNKLLKNPSTNSFPTKKDKLELIYGVFNYIVMFYLIFNIINTYKLKLLTFPYQLIQNIFTDTKNLLNYVNDNIELLIISIVFYLIVFNLLKRLIPNKSKAQQ